MTDKIRKDSGDSYANWEDVKCDRQSYANSVVARYQQMPGIKPFADLLTVFRHAGEEYDRWMDERDAERAA